MESWKLRLQKCFGELLSTMRSLTYWSKSSGEQLGMGACDRRGKTVRAAGFAQPGVNPVLMGCYREDGASLSTYKLQLIRYKKEAYDNQDSQTLETERLGNLHHWRSSKLQGP